MMIECGFIVSFCSVGKKITPPKHMNICRFALENKALPEDISVSDNEACRSTKAVCWRREDNKMEIIGFGVFP